MVEKFEGQEPTDARVYRFPELGSPAADFLGETSEATSLEDEIDRLLSDLQIYESDILKYRFGLDRDGCEPRLLEEVANHFGLSREQVDWIERRAMQKVRNPSDNSE